MTGYRFAVLLFPPMRGTMQDGDGVWPAPLAAVGLLEQP